MGMVYEAIDESLSEFIQRQQMFFVATAPMSGDGLVNLSPKGLDSLRILDAHTVAYADLTGSGIETVAHLKENGRIVLMFCAFDGSPNIVRLHGRGEVIEPGHDEFEILWAQFPEYTGLRSFIRIHCQRISDSCGWSVPLYEFKSQRSQLLTWAENKGRDGMSRYQREKNHESLDGLAGIAANEETKDSLACGKPATNQSISEEVIRSTVASFRMNKKWADKAIAQLPDEKLRVALDENTNSIAVIMKHVGGNLKSRWTEFLTTDGEKSWRDRDDEFVDSFKSRDELLGHWEDGWNTLFDSLATLQPDDLSKSVTIRGDVHSVSLAMQRSLAHCAYHIGQIIMVARILAKDDWETITVPRGESATFNQTVWGKGKSYNNVPETDTQDNSQTM